nr:MAG TPA: hypothetical protein [Caudoviricetes sp.]
MWREAAPHTLPYYFLSWNWIVSEKRTGLSMLCPSW